MPARRRRTASRSPSQRFRMWDAKVKGDVYATQLKAVKPIVLDRVATYQATHEYLISMVRNIVGQSGDEGALIHEYLWYAQKLWKFAHTYKSKALQLQSDALFLWYLARGRNEVILRTVALALGIKISSTENIIERIWVPILLQEIGKGTLIADGTEQTLLEYVGMAMIQGYIDLQNMTEGDTVRIRAYVKIIEDGDYKLYEEEVYSGAQPQPALYFVPKLSGYAFKATLEQIAGVYKSFDYVFVRGQKAG